jgi:hypothetical protein
MFLLFPGQTVRSQFEVLGDSHGVEDLPLLRHLQQAKTNHLIRFQFLNFLTLEGDGAGTGWVNAADYVEQRALAGSIAANKRHHLSLFDMKGHPAQNLYIVVVCGYVLNAKHHEARFGPFSRLSDGA